MATPTTLPATFVAGNVLTAAQMNDLRGAFRILQVVSTTKTDTFSTSSTSFTDITGLSVSITPSSTSSKVLVIARVNFSAGSNQTSAFRLMRDTTAIGVGDSAGSRLQTTSRATIAAAVEGEDAVLITLDSPSSTSSIPYHVEVASQATIYVNRSSLDTDSASSAFARSSSSITVMEVSA